MASVEARIRARRLIAAANELLAIARELESHEPTAARETVRAEDRAIPLGHGRDGDSALWGELAQQAYADRRRRQQIFGDEELFGEPAWDILLDLFIAAKERKRVPVTSACIGAAVPPTTALRWIKLLENHGLVLRDEDPHDARRFFLRLSADAYMKMVEYFRRSSRPIRMDEEEYLLRTLV